MRVMPACSLPVCGPCGILSWQRTPVEFGGLDADTRFVLRDAPFDSETQPLWSLGDKVILGLIAFVMLGTSAAVFLGLIK